MAITNNGGGGGGYNTGGGASDAAAVHASPSQTFDGDEKFGTDLFTYYDRLRALGGYR